MKRILLLFCLMPALGGCVIGQQIYDERRLDECRELPTADERRTCEREARDAEAGIPPAKF